MSRMRPVHLLSSSRPVSLRYEAMAVAHVLDSFPDPMSDVRLDGLHHLLQCMQCSLPMLV